MTQDASQTIRRLLIIMPSWVGDVVMATPTLRSLRELLPDTHISVLVKHNVKPLLEACPWVDRIVSIRPSRRGMADGRRKGALNLARRLSRGRFDTAIILPNSFRTALLARVAGIPRRIGYDRDGRGFLLTDRLLPRRVPGKFVPVSTRDYYLGIARYLGAHNPSPAMELFTRPEDDARADELLRKAGFDVHGKQKLVLVNPGANFGDAKIWYADRFAKVADRAVGELGAVVAVTGAPKEKQIVADVLASASVPVIDLPRHGMDLTLLKSIIKRASAMVTNDTGPRHLAAAMGVPVVTIFGPTDPVWSEIDFPLERKVRVDVFCGPCQKKRCPLDHRCMKLVEPDMVFDRLAELLRTNSAITAP